MKETYLEKLIASVLILAILWRLSEYAAVPDVRPAFTGQPKFDGLTDNLTPNGFPSPPPAVNVDGKRRISDAEAWHRIKAREAHKALLEEQQGGGR